MQKSVSINIYGRVQGVGFRYSTQARAISLNIKGFVKNMSDGSVYIEASGDEEKLQKFIQWCRQGPPLAMVSDICLEEGANAHDEGFVIR